MAVGGVAPLAAESTERERRELSRRVESGPRAGSPHGSPPSPASSPLPWTSWYSPIRLTSMSVEAPLGSWRRARPSLPGSRCASPGRQLRTAEGDHEGPEAEHRVRGRAVSDIGECWHHGTATFMILGDVCTGRARPVRSRTASRTSSIRRNQRGSPRRWPGWGCSSPSSRPSIATTWLMAGRSSLPRPSASRARVCRRAGSKC